MEILGGGGEIITIGEQISVPARIRQWLDLISSVEFLMVIYFRIRISVDLVE